jgi:hypothetical protein
MMDKIAHRFVSEIIVTSRVSRVAKSDRPILQRREKCQRDVFDFSHVHCPIGQDIVMEYFRIVLNLYVTCVIT